jgi:formamidopyrimidine-DNA glycosylase
MFIGDSSAIAGLKIVGIVRQAKILHILLDDRVALLIHFKLNGQFFWEKPGKNLDKRFTRVILHLNDGSRLLFNDSRKFAWMKVIKNYQEEKPKAIEPFRDDFTVANLEKILARSRKPIKLLLMDQEKIAGIGNIYANEALFAARIDPFRSANTLKAEEIKKLREAVLKILKKAIECKGSSGKDEWFRQLNAKPGGYQEHFLVYQKEGQKCPGICHDTIKRKKQSGRSTFWCPKCQK